ncbi:DNA sulfur modification protein DndB [Anoxybacillus gonensis]|uniref:DNA sulfur modification protein DndB n=1 Tax=Anoxybacillus gonensis TaxID=198467 RepID=UPI0002BF7B40|nr:DNA sulfur modification protein DndB [Anoxybacillus gonensis]EMI10195.1 SPBc2 prophage-derived protein YopQ [Anoxybacillus gonensis]
MQNREALLDNLINTIEAIKDDRKRVGRIKNGLKKYKILPGTVQSILNEPKDKLLEVDDKTLYLLTEQIYSVSNNPELIPQKYFSDREIKEVKTTYESDMKDDKVLPFTLKNVIQIEHDVFSTVITGQELKKLFDAKVLNYNPETQRETKVKTVKDSPNQIIHEVKVNKAHANRIAKSILENTVFVSTITLNARVGTSDVGEELIYDEETMSLTITEGTILDVIDGFHRITATIMALNKEPNAKVTFMLKLTNFTVEKAKADFAQLNTIIPVSQAHVKRIAKERYSDFIVDQLKFNSELKGRIVDGASFPTSSNMLVTSVMLSEAIDEFYEIETKAEAIKVANYLKEFFNTLFYAYPDEFLGDDLPNIRKESLINTNIMFYGYVLLSKRMKEESVDIGQLPNIISSIDFSRNNKVWTDLEVLNDKGQINIRAKRGLKKFFTELKIK